MKTTKEISLDWKRNGDGNRSLSFRNMEFEIVKASERAYEVQCWFPLCVKTNGGKQLLMYNTDFQEGYESIESAEYSVETWLSNILGFNFND